MRESTSPSKVLAVTCLWALPARENEHSLGFPEVDDSVAAVETNEGNLFKKTPAGVGCQS